MDSSSRLDFSAITGDLFIGVTPRSSDYATLRDLGVRLVINMRFERRPAPDPHNPPMGALWLPTFDNPLIPIPIHALRRGVKAALGTIASGGKVYTHCAAGVHRGVAMGAAILTAQGHSPEDAMRLIKLGRSVADPDIWYIRKRILRFAETWGIQEK